jgi:hypothetical protein
MVDRGWTVRMTTKCVESQQQSLIRFWMQLVAQADATAIVRVEAARYDLLTYTESPPWTVPILHKSDSAGLP